jgi:hypothetical protein
MMRGVLLMGGVFTLLSAQPVTAQTARTLDSVRTMTAIAPAGKMKLATYLDALALSPPAASLSSAQAGDRLRTPGARPMEVQKVFLNYSVSKEKGCLRRILMRVGALTNGPGDVRFIIRKAGGSASAPVAARAERGSNGQHSATYNQPFTIDRNTTTKYMAEAVGTGKISSWIDFDERCGPQPRSSSGTRGAPSREGRPISEFDRTPVRPGAGDGRPIQPSGGKPMPSSGGKRVMVGVVALLAVQAAAAQTARTPDSASTMTAIAQAESQGAARTQGAVRLRVPVKLTRMLPEAQRVSVHCFVSGDGGSGSARSSMRPVVDGEFDQVIDIVVAPNAGETLIGAKSYGCRLEIHGPGGAVGNPSQGTPPSNQLFKLARPNAYFKAVVAGSLDRGTVNDGLVGPGRLAVPPKRRQ